MSSPETATTKQVPSHEKSNRWWEFYGIRYAMGTVVGAIVVFVIGRDIGVLPASSLFSQQKDWGAPELITLAACGLTFCYIASAPILVLHATRFIESKLHQLIYRTSIRFVAVLIIWGFIYVFFILFNQFVVKTQSINPVFLGMAAVFALGPPLLLFPLCQFIFMRTALRQRDHVFTKYSELAIKRTSTATDIVESYRHLREHGNSFAIVFLELVLGSALWLLNELLLIMHPNMHSELLIKTQLLIDIITIVIWIAPAGLVWQFATDLEKSFIDP